MKCDELKAYNVVATADVNPEVVDSLGCTEWTGYDKNEVDAAIAEIKAENERLVKCCKEYDSRQRIDERIKFNGAQQLRATKRALWLARADRAMMTLDYFTLKCRWFEDYMKVEPPKSDVKMIHKWYGVERKCRAKAEEYK